MGTKIYCQWISSWVWMCRGKYALFKNPVNLLHEGNAAECVLRSLKYSDKSHIFVYISYLFHLIISVNIICVCTESGMGSCQSYHKEKTKQTRQKPLLISSVTHFHSYQFRSRDQEVHGQQISWHLCKKKPQNRTTQQDKDKCLLSLSLTQPAICDKI